MTLPTPAPVAWARSVSLRSLVVCVIACVAAIARADEGAAAVDTTEPFLNVELPAQTAPGAFTVRAEVFDESRVLVATLYWRPAGTKDWRVASMESTGDALSVTLDVKGDIELWVEAFDELGNGPGFGGSAAEPLKLKVVDPTAPPPQRPRPPPPPPPPAPPPKPSRPSLPMPTARVVRVATARELVAGRWEFALNGTASVGTDVLVPGGKLLGGAGDVRLSWTPVSFAEVVVGATGRGASISAAGLDDMAQSVGDPFVHARFVSPAIGGLRFAGELSLDVPLPEWSDPRFAVSPGVLVAATWSQSHLRASINAGYRWDNSENVFPSRVGAFGAFAMGVSAFDQLRLGAALELPVSIVVPFVEYSADVPVDRRHYAACDAAECRTPPSLFPLGLPEVPQRLGAGFRFEFGETVALVLAAEMGLSRAGVGLSRTDARAVPVAEGVVFAPPWSGHVSFRWQLGTPLDASTDAKAEPVPAKVETAPANPESTPANIETAPANVETAPANVEMAPAKVESAPANVETAPAKNDAAPANVETAPAKNDAAPATPAPAPTEQQPSSTTPPAAPPTPELVPETASFSASDSAPPAPAQPPTDSSPSELTP